MPRNLPRPPLTPARVIAAAVALADAEGIDALSMRRLARELGVEAMSIYNHVPGKDALLLAMVEAVMAEVSMPFAGETWVDQMRDRAHQARALLLRHPWAGQLLVSLMNVGPRMLGYVDATLGVLLRAGFSHDLADRAWNAMDSHIYGFTLQELNFPVQPKDYARTAEAYLPTLPPDLYPHMRALAEDVIAGRHDGIADFDFGLDLILSGLQARVRA